MGMQQYSQVISAQMPQAYGIGQYGMPGPTAPQFAQVPYAPRQQAGFNYGGASPFGYGMGNQFGAAGVSAMGGAGQFALSGLGMAGGLGLLGRASNFFDPISAGVAGFGAARGIGMGVAGGLGVGAMAAGAVAAPMMFAQHALGSMVTGAQEQAGINQSLGQFNFINSASRSGRGFSRQDAQGIGSMVRELQSLPEMMTSMSELTRIMDKMGQSGMMQGVRDAGEFSKKFKETIHTLKDISKMMGTTMEEAMKTFQESRQQGFYSPDAVKQNIMQGKIVSGLTGMTEQQVNQMKQYGSEVSKQYGGSRAGGAASIGRISGELGMAQQMGLLSNSQLMEMTGAEGSEGQQRLAMSLNDAGQKMGRSSLGTAMTLALGETKDGRYTGNMDQDLVQRVRSGQISKSELLQLAHQKSAGRNAKLSFAAHRQRLTTEMVNNTGVQGISMELGSILGERGFDNPDALNLVMQRYGANEEQANQIIGMMKQMPQIQRGMAEAGTTTARTEAERAFMRENASWQGISTKISKKFENIFTEPFKKLGASVSNSVGEAVDSFVDDIFGRYQTKVTDLASSTLLKASMGDKAAQRLVRGASGETAAMRKRGEDLRNPSAMGGLLNFASGQQSAGEVQSSILQAMGSNYYDTVKGTGNDEVDVANITRNGGSVLSRSGSMLGAGEYTVTTQAARARARKDLQGANSLEGKIDVSGGIGKFAMLALKNQLLGNKELQNEELTDQQKLEILKKGLNEDSGMHGVLDKLKKSVGSNNEVDVLDALAKAGGMGNQVGMFSRRGLAGGLTGAGSERGLQKRLEGEISSAAGGFKGKEDLAKSVLSEGGSTAKILSAAFGGGKMADAVKMALGDKEGTAVSKEVLSALGMTQKEFDSSRAQGRELVSAGMAGGASGEGINKVLGSQLAMAGLRNEKREKEIGAGLSERINGADLGGLTAGGRGLVGKIGALAGHLSSGQGFGAVGGETSDLVEALADYKGKDRTKVMGLAGDELRAGATMVGDTRSAYRRARGGAGGKSVDSLIEHLGITDAGIIGQVREMAGSDKMVSASEEKNIEKYLGESATKSLAASKGGEHNTVNAAKGLQDYLSKSSDTMSKIGTILDNIVAKQNGTAPTGGK